MSVSEQTWQAVTRFVGMEALSLDTQDWDSWLSLYSPTCTYWLPAWRSDGTLVEDPKAEISLIYYSSRAGLEGRVYRVRTGRAASALVLPRTVHMINPVDVQDREDGVLKVRANWTVHSSYEERVATCFGYALYELSRNHEGALQIQSKTTVLLNDRVHEVLDFYNV